MVAGGGYKCVKQDGNYHFRSAPPTTTMRIKLPAKPKMMETGAMCKFVFGTTGSIRGAIITNPLLDCVPCAANEWSADGKGQCATCGAGQSPNSDKSGCVNSCTFSELALGNGLAAGTCTVLQLPHTLAAGAVMHDSSSAWIFNRHRK